MKIETRVRAGGLTAQHNETLARGLRVHTAVKAGGVSANHNQSVTSGLRARTAINAGEFPVSANHNETVASGLCVRTAVKAGEFPVSGNHNETAASGLRMRTAVKAGDYPISNNHNESAVSGLRVRTAVNAGDFPISANHNESVTCGVPVCTAVRAGDYPISANHNESAVSGLRVRTAMKAGDYPISGNHNETVASGLRVHTAVKAGGLSANHNETVASGLRMRTAVRAGDYPITNNHNESVLSGMPVRTTVTAGEHPTAANHHETVANGLRVCSELKAGTRVDNPNSGSGLTSNHNETVASGLRVRTAVKAGEYPVSTNHNLTLLGGSPGQAAAADDQAAHGEYVLATGSAAVRRLFVLHNIYSPAGRRVLLQAGLTRGMRVADFGCGVGVVTRMLSEMVGPSGSVTGIDANGAQLEQANQICYSAGCENTTFIEADACSTGLPRGSYDLVYCRYLLLHLPDPAACLREMCTVLKPGGIIVVEDGDLATATSVPPTALDAFADLFTRIAPLRGVDYSMSRNLYHMVKAAGFSDPQIRIHQPAEVGGDIARLLKWSVEEAGPGFVAAGLITPVELDRTLAAMQAASEQREVLALAPRMSQVWARKAA